MRTDQIAYAIIFLVPFVLLTIDWRLDFLWSEKAIDVLRIPWILFVAAWIIIHQDWGAFAIAVPLGLGFFFQKSLKERWPHR